jgi:L-aminopeptidase/D-esterase-like protein
MGSDGVTGVPGIRVGHYTDRDAATGCTVVLCEEGAVGGVDVRGAAPGTRETDLLRPSNLVSEVHAVLLSGGSAFGLDAAGGVMRYLEERGVGFGFGEYPIPIVPAAILFDLGLIDGSVRPGPDEGYAACLNAADGPVAEGSVGAGTGATVGKLLGMDRAVKGGIGTDLVELGDGTVVGAIVAVNALGGVFDPDTGQVVAGPRTGEGIAMHDSLELIVSPGFRGAQSAASGNTTIGIVATNSRLDVEQANKLAQVAHDGLAMTVRPAHTMRDGDTMFGLATGTDDGRVDMDRLCAATALSVSRSIVRAVVRAEGIGGIPSVRELANNDVS